MDHGDLALQIAQAVGSSSTTHGYCCGGYTGSPIAVTDTINKFAYASNTTAADHGNLHTGVRWPAGHQV